MTIILDASSAINLVHGDALIKVLELPGHEFCLGPQVLEECEGEATELQAAIAQEKLRVLDDSKLSGSLFATVLAKYRLGLGETECLAFALSDAQLSFCSDDRKARAIGKAALGEGRVLGTMSLLRECVRHGVFASSDAREAYREMLARGGFLPNLPSGYFD